MDRHVTLHTDLVGERSELVLAHNAETQSGSPVIVTVPAAAARRAYDNYLARHA